MQDVLALAGEPPPRTVDGRRPVRSLLHHIDGGQHFGAGGPQEDAIAGLAAFEGGAPTVDGRGHGFHTAVIIILSVRKGNKPPNVVSFTTLETESRVGIRV